MGNPAGVPRDFEALEKRRFQAIQMLERGLRQAEIARQLRVVPQTVARWMHDYGTHGKSALRKGCATYRWNLSRATCLPVIFKLAIEMAAAESQDRVCSSNGPEHS